ncbi:hypothetical protein P4K96_23700 [Bacillus cereus]|uniref:hypothetical protein n=1 Tax=Paenibacillus melissococcoides TaxID=2912268 RepID=UPI002DCDBBC2|nr:hypothetical protein [Bacillus cereus]
MNWERATIPELCAVIMGGEATEEEVEAAGAELFRRIGGNHELPSTELQAFCNGNLGDSADL